MNFPTVIGFLVVVVMLPFKLESKIKIRTSYKC